MNLQSQKRDLIELLINIDDQSLLNEIKSLLIRKHTDLLKPISLEDFYAKIASSEKAIRKGAVTSQKNVRKEIQSWRKK